MKIFDQVYSKENSPKMFDLISSTYDRINRILSFGIDIYWRRQLAKHLPLKDNMRLLDLATGTCDQLIASLSSKRSFEHALGIDLSENMLKVGQKKIYKRHLSSLVTLKLASALDIPSKESSFDVVTMSFGIRNIANTALCLQEIYRVLDKGGKALILEFSVPKKRWIRASYLFYLRNILPRLGRLLSRNGSAYSYLNETIETFPYGKRFSLRLERAGFRNIQYYPLTFGVVTLYVAEK